MPRGRRWTEFEVDRLIAMRDSGVIWTAIARELGRANDPQGGAGTTGLVADRLRRNAILIELNPEYAAIAERRIATEAGMLGDVRIELSQVPA